MKPSIPVPCSEDWNQMKIVQYARHCESCRKNVMDFTQFSREEILTYLLENGNKEVCGRIFPQQLDFRHEEIMVVIGQLEKKHKNTNLSYFLLTMATLSLAGCKQDEYQKLPAHDKVEQKAASGLQEVISENSDIPTVVEKPVIDKIQEKPVQLLPKYTEPNAKRSRDTAFFNSFPEVVVEGYSYRTTPTSGIIVYHDEDIKRQPIFRKKTVACVAEVMPEFEGGTEALQQYVKDNLKYPKREKREGVEGTVYASFLIDEKGRVSRPVILQSVSGSKGFDRAVRRLIRKMPDWTPASNQGVNTKIRFNMPFVFELK